MCFREETMDSGRKFLHRKLSYPPAHTSVLAITPPPHGFTDEIFTHPRIPAASLRLRTATPPTPTAPSPHTPDAPFPSQGIAAPSSVPPRFKFTIPSPRHPSSSHPPWTTPQSSRPKAEGRSSPTSSSSSPEDVGEQTAWPELQPVAAQNPTAGRRQGLLGTPADPLHPESHSPCAAPRALRTEGAPNHMFYATSDDAASSTIQVQ